MSLSVINPALPLQPEYQAPLNDLLACLTSGLESTLHSVYVYGSVARKTARPNHSNLNVIVVLNQPLDERWPILFNTVKWRFQKNFPYVTEVCLKTALVKEVASLSSLFSWGFILKHLSVCVHGNNLGDSFGSYQPSWEIAKFWNMDLEEWLTKYRHQIVKSSNGESQIKAQKMIAQKLLRASHTLIMHKDKRWYDDPLACGEGFLRYFPEKEKEIKRLGILLSGRLIAKRSVIGILDGFGGWLVQQYKRTEFRIG